MISGKGIIQMAEQYAQKKWPNQNIDFKGPNTTFQGAQDYSAALPSQTVTPYSSPVDFNSPAFKYDYTTPTAGQLGVGGWSSPTIQAPNYSDFNIKAPKLDYSQYGTQSIQMPDYSQMGNLQDYTGRIGEYANKAIQSGLQQLGELTFKPEYDVERERQESRGLVGSGVENQNLQNLLTSQQARAGEFATNIQNQAFKEQTAELQNLRELTEGRERLKMEQGFTKGLTEAGWKEARTVQQISNDYEAGLAEAGWNVDLYKQKKQGELDTAIANGNLEQAKNIHQDMVKIDMEKMTQENEQFKKTFAVDIEKFKSDDAYRKWSSDLESQKYALDYWESVTGMNLEEEKLDLTEQELYGNQVAQAGLKGDDFFNALNDMNGGGTGILAVNDQERRNEEARLRTEKERYRQQELRNRDQRSRHGF